MGKKSKSRATTVASNAAGKKNRAVEGSVHRRDLEWFERLARVLASLRSQGPAGVDGRGALARLVEAGRFLRYTVAPEEAMAYLKALLGSREKLVNGDDRLYLRRLIAAALPEIRKKALPPKPSGTQYVLTIHEERRLTRAYRGLVKFFGARKQLDPTLEELNKQVAEFYPPWNYEDAKLADAQLKEVLNHRSPRRRAMAALVFLHPLGKKAIERRCYAIDKDIEHSATS
jgi:hypothetical protein